MLNELTVPVKLQMWQQTLSFMSDFCKSEQPELRNSTNPGARVQLQPQVKAPSPVFASHSTCAACDDAAGESE